MHVTQILSDDYSKAAFLCEDRSNHFHANLMTDVTHACDADTV